VIPQTVKCDDCSSTAKVRGYGRIEYQWNDDNTSASQVVMKSIRLTIDCPLCGVKPQDHHPAATRSASRSTPRQR
jgi:hypothetical protein